MARAAFTDRRHAGRALEEALGPDEAFDLVLALPRGGVPVAYEIARARALPLDLVLVRKIRAPGHAELALGAVVGGKTPHMVLNEDIVGRITLPPDYLEAQRTRELAEIARRQTHYLGRRPPETVAGRRILVVDDGVATGATAQAALDALRAQEAFRIVLAAPIGAPDAVKQLQTAADRVLCLRMPADFMAVGHGYDTFEQTPDSEVVALLDAARENRG